MSRVSTLFSRRDYDVIHEIAFGVGYPGNAFDRGIIESPNGDGNLDIGKRYSHVAVKYLDQMNDVKHRDVLLGYLVAAHDHAIDVSKRLRVPSAYLPRFETGALRIIEYPPGIGSHAHTDLDLFTLMCYRDQPDRFCYIGDASDLHNDHGENVVDPMLHLGELSEIIGVGRAHEHRVLSSDTTQHSIVYFAVPSHDVTLPINQTVGKWLDERLARSRRMLY